MTSRERVAAAMRHQKPDRVPVMCQLALGHYFIHGGHQPADIWFDSEVLASTMLERCRHYGFDGVLVNLPGRPADWRQALAEERRRGDDWELRWNNGVVVSFPPDDNPQALGSDGQPLPRADYTRVDPRDPATYRQGGYVWGVWHAPALWDIPADADLSEPATYPAWFTAALRAARRLGPELSVHAEVFSPFTHLMELFGYDQTLMALVDEPQRCHELLDRFVGIVTAQVGCYAACGPDAVLISSAFAGAGFISREMYREFVLPYERRVVTAIRERQLPAYTHTCGAIGDRLDLMASTGVDGLDTLDPPPLGTVDLAEAKAAWGHRLFFKGNLDAVNEMLRADDQTFEAAVRERLEIGKPGGGYILSSACSVAPHVAPERLQTMVALAERYGRYE